MLILAAIHGQTCIGLLSRMQECKLFPLPDTNTHCEEDNNPTGLQGIFLLFLSDFLLEIREVTV